MPDAIVTERRRLAGDLAHLGALTRDLKLDRAAIDEEARTVDLAWASELPYERWFGTEILDVSVKSVRLDRLRTGAALLVNHDYDQHVGVVEDVSIGQDRVARARVRFGESALATEVFRDVVTGIRSLTSVGYRVHEMVLEKSSDAGDIYRVTDWEPYEISIVSVPADPSVGVGRSAEPSTPDTRIIRKEQKTMEQVKEAPAAPDIKIVADNARNEERARMNEIVAAGRAFGCSDLADQFVADGRSVREFFDACTKLVASRNAEKVSETRDIGMTDKEVKSYSLMRAIRAMADGNWSHAGFERECHEAALKKSGTELADARSFRVPHDVQARLLMPKHIRELARTNPQALEQMVRDLTVGTTTAGGHLVATNNLAASFVELLRNRALVMQLGALSLPGLQGSVTVPKQTAAATAYWLTNEATAITESQQTLGQLALSPKNVGAYTEISRQLMLQSSPAADMLVMNDLQQVLALAIDAAALNGSGASGQPTGVIGTSGIGAVTGTSLAYAGIVEFQTDVAGGNALTPNCTYVTTPTVAGLMMQRQRFSSTDTPLWTGNLLDGQMAGFRAASTVQMPSAAMLFGNFEQIVVAEWGTLEIAPNPFANFAAGITGIRGIVTVDIGVRVAGGFSYASSIT